MNTFEVCIPSRTIEVHQSTIPAALSGTIVDFLKNPKDGAGYISDAVGRSVEMNVAFMQASPAMQAPPAKINFSGCFFRPFDIKGNGYGSCGDPRILEPTTDNFVNGRTGMFTTNYFKDKTLKDSIPRYVPTGAYTAVQADRKYEATHQVGARLRRYYKEHSETAPINAIVPLILYSTPVDTVQLYGMVYGLAEGYIRESDKVQKLLSTTNYGQALQMEALVYGSALSFLHRSTRLFHGQPTLSNVAANTSGQIVFLDWATSRELDEMNREDRYLNMAGDVAIASASFGSLLKTIPTSTRAQADYRSKLTQYWADHMCAGYLDPTDTPMAQRNMRSIASLPSVNHAEARIRAFSKLISDRYPETHR
ncbi:MAG: hypothetical protein WCO78_04910 [Candidatus Roizmanbacteria bacterium]